MPLALAGAGRVFGWGLGGVGQPWLRRIIADVEAILRDLPGRRAARGRSPKTLTASSSRPGMRCAYCRIVKATSLWPRRPLIADGGR